MNNKAQERLEYLQNLYGTNLFLLDRGFIYQWELYGWVENPDADGKFILVWFSCDGSIKNVVFNKRPTQLDLSDVSVKMRIKQ